MNKQYSFWLWAGAALVAGLVLRLWFVDYMARVVGDSLVYGDIAKTWLQHGMYGLSADNSTGARPTLIRLPGYPLFLAACFRLFGMENYFAAACVQIVFELLGCLLLASFVRHIAPLEIKSMAASATLGLAALCPFTASYTASPMAETPTLFVLALAMWAMARFREQPCWANALWFSFAVT